MSYSFIPLEELNKYPPAQWPFVFLGKTPADYADYYDDNPSYYSSGSGSGGGSNPGNNGGQASAPRPFGTQYTPGNEASEVFNELKYPWSFRNIENAQADPENTLKYGIGAARNVFQDMAQKEYAIPEWYGDRLEAPTVASFYDFLPNGTLNRVGLPTYGVSPESPEFRLLQDLPNHVSLMNADYDRWEDALREKGEQQIREEFDDSEKTLRDVMGARGLYGSSLQAGEMKDMAEREARSLAGNASEATARRMSMQQQDLENLNRWQMDLFDRMTAQRDAESRFNMELYNAGLSDLAERARFDTNVANLATGQEMGIWETGLKDAVRESDYLQSRLAWDDAQDERRRSWVNDLVREENDYAQLTDQYDRGIDDMLFNNAMSLSTGAVNPYSAISDYNVAQQNLQADRRAANSANQMGWANTLMNFTSGLLGQGGSSASSMLGSGIRTLLSF